MQVHKTSEPRGLPFPELFFFLTRLWDQIYYYDKWVCFRFDYYFHLVLLVQILGNKTLQR